MRLLSYIMETDCMEALTPICVSLTNLAKCQLHESDEEAGVAGKSKHVNLPAPQKLLARLLNTQNLLGIRRPGRTSSFSF